MVHVNEARAHELSAGTLRLLGESFVPTDAVHGDGARRLAAEGDFAAVRRVDERAGDAVDDRVLADLGLFQRAGADQAGAVRGDADATVLLEESNAQARAGEVARGPRARRPGADDGDVAVEGQGRGAASWGCMLRGIIRGAR